MRYNRVMLRRLSEVFAVFLLASLLAGNASAQDDVSASSNTDQYSSQVQTLKQNITDRQDEIKKLEDEIADYKTRISNVGNQKKTLQSAVQTLDLSRAKLAADIKLTQVKIANANDTISAL